MASARKARKKSAVPGKPRKKRSAVWKDLAACACVIGLCFFVKAELDIYSQTVANRQQLAALKDQKKEVDLSIAEKKELLSSIVDGDASDEKILRIIRARGYVYPDEVIYYDVD